MATKTGLLKDKAGNFFLPQTDANLVTGLSQVATNGSYNNLKDTPDLSQFVTNTVSNLTNYYLKKDVYSKSEIQTLLATLNTFSYLPVDSLPDTPSEFTMWKIYLVPNSENPETRDQYITIESRGAYSWVKIGNTGMDLSAYTTTEQLTQLLSGKQASLVSGTNIKKLAGQDILGSGDLVKKILVAGTVLCAPKSKTFLALICSGGAWPLGLWTANQTSSEFFGYVNNAEVFSTSDLNCLRVSAAGYWYIHVLVGESDIQFTTKSYSSLTITKQGSVSKHYFKPKTGIPIEDLSLDVQKALRSIGSKEPSFGGFYVSSGSLIYNSGAYSIANNWDAQSYGEAYGLQNGSTYFNFVEMGQLFEKANFSEQDGSVENVLNPLDGWRLPSKNDFVKIIGTIDGETWLRPGSEVNGVENVHFTFVNLTDYTFTGYPTFFGILLFPDNCLITGTALNGDCDDKSSGNLSELTTVQLNEYIEQGCVFLPAFGYMEHGEWNPFYATLLSNEVTTNNTNGPDLFVWMPGTFTYASDITSGTQYDGTEKTSAYLTIRLIKSSDLTSDIDSKYTKPADGIPISDLNQEIVSILNNADAVYQSTKTFDTNGMYEPYLLFSGNGLAIISMDYENVVALVKFGSYNPILYDFSGVFTYNDAAYDHGNWQAVGGLRDDIIKVTILSSFYNPEVVLRDVAESYTDQYQNTYLGSDLPCRRFYVKPASGIPSTDLNSSIQTSLTKADSAYQKPSNGIDIADLSTSVQISLDKADTSVSYSEQYLTSAQKSQARTNIGAGTYTKPAGGIPISDLNLEASQAFTNAELVANKVTSISSSSTNTQYPSAKCVYDNLATKQNTIDANNKLNYSFIEGGPNVVTVSTNIVSDKNNNTKAASPKAVYDEIHPVIQTSIPSGGLKPNVLYNFKSSQVGNTPNFAFAASENSSVVNHWYWTYDSGSTIPNPGLPQNITWANGTPTFAANKHYEFSVLGNYGIVLEV